ncbi:MAG: aquaporin, partial [Brevibacterium aurantiacum]|nr:aquaporin [Brevibacterium aurantiacum]
MVLLQKPSLVSKIFAEFLGTFVLVFGGCGAAVFAAKVVGDDGINMGIGFLGVALAFGLTVVVMAYAVGHISGGHFNPAVTLGCVLAG